MADQEFLRAEALDEAVRLYTALTAGGQQTVNALMPAAAVAPDVLVAAGVDVRFVSNTAALPRSPTSAELAAAPPDRPLGGMYRPGGQVQRVRWDVVTGAWVANGAPIPSATQVEQAQATAEAAQADADAATTALSRTGVAQLAALPITAPPPVLDGSRWIGQPGGIADDLGTVVAAAGGDTWRREGVYGTYQADWVLNPLTTPTQRTVALQNAVAALPSGQTLELATDDKTFVPLNLNPANDTTLVCKGSLKINPGTGYALTIEPINPTDVVNGRLHRVRVVGGLRIENLSSTPRATGSGGVKIVNLFESLQLDIDRLEGFEIALCMFGTGGYGCSYNTVNLGRFVDNKIGLLCDQNGDGWSTENTYAGGRFAWTTSVTPGDGWVHVRTMPPTSALGANDNNRFAFNSFESNSLGGLAFDIDGNHNALLRSRIEFTGYTWNTVLGRVRSGATGTYLDMGFDVYRANILDFGTNTYIRSRDSISQSGGNRNWGVFDAGAVFDGSDIMFRARNTTGTPTYVVYADGRVVATGLASVGGVVLPDGPLILSTPANTPNGVVVAPQGSLCLATGGTGATLWIKESGSGATGWVAK